MTRLSVNINKIATLRNARGGNNPDVIKSALDCERFGAQGITVHPRPDERHIRYDDVIELKKVITTEFNIEGYPDDRYMELVKRVKPAQATLVPDGPHVLTSNAGWDTLAHEAFLKEITKELHEAGVRVSIFVDPDSKMVENAAKIGADRVELYTESYATKYVENKENAILPFKKAAEAASKSGLGLNAGHDLDLDNLAYLAKEIPELDEVSIGHALICDALYLGLENTIQMYLKQLKI
ncbi:pyridoxine 5'-phosphate synthase [Fulvivirga sediminis]|uniref:Pyridoxine 5'-phosphate synthase n=1 Tax=Fulvivirga sediminis TaxID=2803949 RepID=A0A937JZ44_9BACT|nr:pyridoxine 5'-phosphate synthase [Fulvivirga sediminis]MBL3654895.1 pyridoxine 5'-phosphate synthase [Fulvivirga sediminis]